MTDKTEQSPSPQDDSRTILKEALMQAAQALLRQTQSEAIALQVPDTKTLIAVGPRVGIAGLLGLAEFVIVDDATATAVRNALVPGPSIGEVLAAKDRTIAELRAALASQSQAAQPTELTDERALFEKTFDNAKGASGTQHDVIGWYYFDEEVDAMWKAWQERAAIAAHLAGQSQATKAQAEPSEPGPLNTLLQIAEFLDSNSKPQQTGVDTFDYASEFDYNLSHAACTIRSIVADLSEPVASVAKEAPAVPEGFVLMPKSLTAENGAKSLFIGEFKEHITVECPECNGDEECHVCGGDGYIQQDITVEWDTIKNIYALAVEHLAAAPQAPATQEAPVVPDILFDGFSVYAEMDKKAHARTSADNVSDVLDAVVRLIRRATPAIQEAEIGSVQVDLTSVDCPACGGRGGERKADAWHACDECDGQGRVIVSRKDLADLAPTTSTVSAPGSVTGIELEDSCGDTDL